MADLASGLQRYPAVGDLVVLVAVAEQHGVSAAPRALGIPQPNASRALRRLERQLRLTLVERTPRGSALTADGAVVVDWARQVVEDYEQLSSGAAALGHTHRAQLRIAASQTIAEGLLPRWLAALRAENPRAQVALTVTNSAEVGRLVSGGDVLGFVESPALPATITVPVGHCTISTDRLVVVVDPGHDWARRTRPVSLAELASTPLVVREPGSGTRVSFEQALAGLTLTAPALELASNVAVRIAVAAGAGPAVLSEHAVQAAVASGELRAVMVDGLLVERPLQAVWAEGQPPGASAARLVELAVTAEAGRAVGG